MKNIKVAIVGLGNCASSLIQGVEYYKYAEEKENVPGLMHVKLGGYHIRDIKFVAAFDVNERKIGLDISKAIFKKPNNAKKFSSVPRLNAKVYKGPVLDGVGKYVKTKIPISSKKEVNVVSVLKKTKAEIVVNFLPVGSEKATKFWADASIKAKCAFINCIPVFIASEKLWAREFELAKLPIIGDDIKSQVGATILHRTLTNLFLDRGMPIDRTYQLNTGGNMDFLNMLERERLKMKKISKTNSVKSQIEARGQKINKENIHIGPSDYVPWLKDNKIAFIRIESREFGNLKTTLECRLSVEDSPNSAGVVIDAIRCAKLALDRKVSGVLEGPSAYFMKSPPRQYDDKQALKMVEEFIAGN